MAENGEREEGAGEDLENAGRALGPDNGDPFAALRSAFSRDEGFRFALFVKDERARRTGTGYVRQYDALPDLEQVREEYGGGVYELKMQDRAGHWRGGSGPFEIVGNRKALAEPAPPVAVTAAPVPDSPVTGAVGSRLEGFEREVLSLRGLLEAVLARTSAPAAAPALDPNRILEMFSKMTGKSSTSEAIELFKLMESVRRGGALPGAEDEPRSVGERVVDLGTRVLEELRARRRAGPAARRRPEAEAEAEAEDGMSLAEDPELRPILDGLCWAYRQGRSPGQTAADARRLVPGFVLETLRDEGFRAFLEDLEDLPGSPFVPEDAAAASWLRLVWAGVFNPAPASKPPATSQEPSAAPGPKHLPVSPGPVDLRSTTDGGEVGSGPAIAATPPPDSGDEDPDGEEPSTDTAVRDPRPPSPARRDPEPAGRAPRGPRSARMPQDGRTSPRKSTTGGAKRPRT
jgi:hypothetical protein